MSKRIIATAGHMISDVTRGCAGFSYDAAGNLFSNGPSVISVGLADGNGNTSVMSGSPLTYYVDAVIGHRRVAPLNAHDCCNDNGAEPTCFACTQASSHTKLNDNNWWHAFDIALLHLDRPLVGVKPVNFVARIGPNDPFHHTYPIDPSHWFGNDPSDVKDQKDPDHVVAMLVGTGAESLADPNCQTCGPRRYGRATLMGLGNTWSNLLDPKSCDAAAFIDFSCTSCMLHLTSTPTASLVFGGPYRIGGDSGSPVIVNDTAHFASPIVGLPLGEPFVVALGSFGRSAGGLPVDDVSPLTWDADLGGGDSTQMGTFILSHLLDWDGDGIWDVFDNCPITPNHDQANCNLDVEKAKGFPQVGDACDPIGTRSRRHAAFAA